MVLNINSNLILKLSDTCVIRLDTLNYRPNYLYSLDIEIYRPDDIIWEFNVRKFDKTYRFVFSKIMTCSGRCLRYVERQKVEETLFEIMRFLSECKSVDELMIYFGVGN